ncbi:MAG: choice-of-anchor D domain-containing protein, partial [Aestuariibacter sp.]|nr:choice-of-anchor D domain-containing protein [Aestuariibacter sp.]
MRKFAFLTTFLLLLLSVSSSFADVSEAHINAGGSDYTATDSTFFVADKAHTAGDFGYGTAGRTFSFSNAVAGTDDDTLYQTVQSGFTFDYLFDVANGDYDVTLYFMEPWQSAAGEREFDVTIEGALALDNYDIFVAAGGQYTAVTETISTTVSDGQLNIEFDRVSRVAMVSAISVVSSNPPTPEPEITVSPTSLAYGDVNNGTDSDLTVTITNDGTADLNVSSLTSTDAAFTVVSPTAPLAITPGNNEVVTVRFSPTATGAYSGNLNIASDDVDEPTVAVALSGNGIEPPPDEPDITVTPTSLDFGNVTTGGSADLTLTIDNDGTQLLTVSSLSISSGEFSVVSPATPFDVAVAASEVVTVRFSPTADGVKNGDLTIASNDPDEGSVIVSLTGEGVSTPAAAYRINVGGPDFMDGSGNLFVADKAYTAGDFGYSGNVRTFSFTSEIANTDDDALYQTMNAGLAVNYWFDLADGDYDVTLYFMEPWQSAAGEREFDVTMEGTLVLDNYDIFAVGGQYTAVSETIPVTISDGQLNIEMDRVNRYAMVSAIEVVSDGGATTPAPEISVSPVSLTYGDVVSGTTSDLTVTISNLGTADLTVSSLTTTDAAFSVVSPTAPVTIPASGNEVVTVRFSATAVTAYSGNLDIASDDADEPTVSVALSGNGVATPPTDPDISLSTTSLAFGTVVVGNSSDQIVSVSNVGASDLTVSDLATTNGVFTIVSPATPFTVGASAATDVTVRFTPTAAGAASGDLNITSDDPDEGVVSVALSGTGSVPTGDTYSNVTSIVGMTTTVTPHASICDKPPMASGSAWADYDNDGDQDVYMTNHGGANYLYRNDGDTGSDGLPDFTNVAASLGVENASLLSVSAVFIDYDNDGDQDLYVSNWDGNSLFENQLIESGSVSFVDVAATAGVVDGGRAITTGWADFNNDGHLDLYVAKHRRCGGDPQAEDHLYESNGDGTFTNVSSYLCGGASTCAQLTGLGFTPGWFDYDNDGDQDLYLVN